MIPLSQLGTPLRIGDVEVRNRVFLAPMSGVTDEPFRSRAYAHGAGLVVSEMVASGELSKGRMESERRIRRSTIPVHMVQLAGREPHHMAEAARIAVGAGPDRANSALSTSSIRTAVMVNGPFPSLARTTCKMAVDPRP